MIYLGTHGSIEISSLDTSIGSSDDPTNVLLTPQQNSPDVELRSPHLQTGNMRDVEFGIAKLAHSGVINVGDAATLDPLPRRQAMVSLTLVVKIRLEVVIDDFAVRLREAGLLLVVAVSKIMSLAAWQEVVAVRLVGRFGAAVVGPDQIGGGLGRLGRLECVH